MQVLSIARGRLARALDVRYTTGTERRVSGIECGSRVTARLQLAHAVMRMRLPCLAPQRGVEYAVCNTHVQYLQCT